MRYSSGMKSAILKRILPPNGESVTEVSRETGVNTNTIYILEAASRRRYGGPRDGEFRPRDRGPGEKLTLLLESKAVNTDDRGEWLRSRGLFTKHLPLWEQEIREIVTEKETMRGAG